MHDDARPEDVLGFWFGRSVKDDRRIDARMPFWFLSNEDTDQEIREQFAALVDKARSGELEQWNATERGTLALIILLDQFPRNLGRGTPTAFASDSHALDLCLTGLEADSHLRLDYIEQVFFMMPMQHSESRQVQRRSVEEFEALLARIPGDRQRHFQGFVKYAHLHNDIVQRFGRFPHRNAILGRTDTDEEKAYLAADAPRFGQK